MSLLIDVAALVFGYLLGGIPVGFLVSKAHGVDIREHGSGRTGGTNVFRALGALPAVITIVGDAIKGALAVLIVRAILGNNGYDREMAAALAGAGAVIGHNWSPFLHFRGGAGGVTSALALLALDPAIGISTILVALIVLYVSRYASVGTLTVGVVGLVMVAILPNAWQLDHIVYALIALAAVALALRPNLERLRQGTERRINFR